MTGTEAEGRSVLVVPSWYPPNGGSFFKRQVLALKKAGIDVSVIYAEGTPVPWLVRRGLKRYCFPPFLRLEGDVPTLRKQFVRTPRRLGKLGMIQWVGHMRALYKDYFRRFGKPDLIHVHSIQWGGTVAREIHDAWGVPYIITEHQGYFGAMTELARSRLKPWQSGHISRALEKASRVIPVGSNLSPKLTEYAPSIKDRITVLSNMIDASFFSPTKREESGGPFRFVVVAYLSEVKGIHLLLPAFSMLLREFPDVRLTIAGDGVQRKELVSMAGRLKIENRVAFTGWLKPPQVKEQLGRADCFVLPSLYEAQPVALLESMAMGLPVMVTKVVSPETVPECCGIRVDVESASALYAGMKYMLENISSYDSRIIRQYALDNFSEDVVVKKLSKIYADTV